MGSGASLQSRKLRVQEAVDYIRDDAIFKKFIGRKYDIENLVFEGGGTKGMAYCGALLALRDMEVLKNVKRFAGASVGSVMAMMCSIGMTPEEIIEHFLFNSDFMQDAPRIALLVNIIKNWGWLHGKRGVNVLEAIVEQKTGDRKTTFEQLYKKFGVELCIVVTNLTHQTPEYFHVKTTPHVSIAYAAIVSCSLPPLIKPSFFRGSYYMDGGLLHNFPISAFDGWYLSMDPDKDYFTMFDKNIEPFGTVNKKTFGLLVFDMNQEDPGKGDFFDKWKYEWPKFPDTKHARKRSLQTKSQETEYAKKVKLAGAIRRVIKNLNTFDKNNDGLIDADELKTVFQNKDLLSDEDFRLLFNEDRSQCDKMLKALDRNSNNQVSHAEVMSFIRDRGFSVDKLILGSEVDASNPTSLFEYISAVVDAMQTRIGSLSRKPDDKDRSACLYTSYIDTGASDLHTDDMKFCMKLGWMSILHHFENHSS
ncbi:uncharacterized protein LOC141902188 [Tubulanus polymorphus]|uniref:uncharacterized protein LOC141902188 n=1 Tax=Tubulanus polymorphus TaxID=672921 RepID=UPI003DA30756